MLEWQKNEQDTALLHRTWTDDFEVLFSLGSKMYITAFEGAHGAACKSLFPWVARYEMAGRNYAEQTEFRIQALRLVQTIEKALDKVDNIERLERYLYALGHRHVHYLPVWLDPEYWDVFKDAVRTGLNDRLNTLPQLSPSERARAIEIWGDIIEYIFEHVKEGFYDGLKGVNHFKI